jgi:hypothetical protein
MQTVYKCNTMANHQDWERAAYLSEENARLRQDLSATQKVLVRREAEMQELREDSARVMHALDCALQLVDCLIAFLPEGMVLPEGVKTCKYRLDEAMDNIRRK